MKKISLFNHKGGVGKTTLTVNLASAFAGLGKRVLVVDTDPQCNLTSFYLEEKTLDELLGESSDKDAGKTIWSAVMPVTRGTGGIKPLEVFAVPGDAAVHLAAGDVMLAEHEEELPAAWTDAFARKERGYNVTCAVSDAVNALAESIKADVVFYDVGPNVGALNRSVLLDSDFFITPVAPDLFSLRALTTVGRSLAKWVKDWQTIRSLASAADKKRLLRGKPAYLGYITSAFKIYGGRAAMPHEFWEGKIAPRVASRIVDELKAADVSLVLPVSSGNKLGEVKDFHSLAASAQEKGLAIGKLRGHVNSGHYAQVDEADAEFSRIAKEIAKRAGI